MLAVVQEDVGERLNYYQGEKSSLYTCPCALTYIYAIPYAQMPILQLPVQLPLLPLFAFLPPRSLSLDINFIILCVLLQSINRGFTPHSYIIYNITYPFYNPTFSRSIPRTSTIFDGVMVGTGLEQIIVDVSIQMVKISRFGRQF